MALNKNKFKTQEDLGEEAAIDQVEDRVEEQMEELEEKTRRNVAEALTEQESKSSKRKESS